VCSSDLLQGAFLDVCRLRMHSCVCRLGASSPSMNGTEVFDPPCLPPSFPSAPLPAQAANIQEALEVGAHTLLVDEDTSATNCEAPLLLLPLPQPPLLLLLLLPLPFSLTPAPWRVPAIAFASHGAPERGLNPHPFCPPAHAVMIRDARMQVRSMSACVMRNRTWRFAVWLPCNSITPRLP